MKTNKEMILVKCQRLLTLDGGISTKKCTKILTNGHENLNTAQRLSTSLTGKMTKTTNDDRFVPHSVGLQVVMGDHCGDPNEEPKGTIT